MLLPRLHYISQGNNPEMHLQHIAKAVANGVHWVQLRLKNYDSKTVLQTAVEAKKITKTKNVILIINDYYEIASEVGAEGVHLGKQDTCPTVARKFLGEKYIIGGTANSLKDCKELIAKKINYIGLGPYQFTNTKKELGPILYIEGYRQILTKIIASPPVFAVGGINMENMQKLISIGVYGVAVSSTITKDFTTIPKFHNLLKKPL